MDRDKNGRKEKREGQNRVLLRCTVVVWSTPLTVMDPKSSRFWSTNCRFPANPFNLKLVNDWAPPPPPFSLTCAHAIIHFITLYVSLDLTDSTPY